MKRIKLKYGTARVADDISEETVQALEKMAELAYKQADQLIKPNMATILNDGSVEGQTFSGIDYIGSYPAPKYGKETYRQFYNRVNQLKEEGFHLGDLSWADWNSYCLGSPHNENYVQDETIDDFWQ